MNVFVTGGAGYIGSVCVEELLNAGHAVTVFDNLTEGHRSAVDPRAKFVLGDLATIDQDGAPVPGVAQAALQGGEQTALNVMRSIRGQELEPFHYTDLGSMATIGRNDQLCQALFCRSRLFAETHSNKSAIVLK